MRDPTWLDDDGLREEPTPRRARPLLIVLAALPWLAVIALLVVPGAPGTETPVRAEGSGSTPSDGSTAGPVDSGANRGPSEAADPDPPGTDPPGTEPPGTHPPDAGLDDAAAVAGRPDPDAPRAGHDDPDLAAVALLAARRWLSGADQHEDALALPARDETQYAEHLHLEGFDGDHELIVARVVALLLDIEADHAPRLQRIAVPLATTPDGPRLLGEPWELPTPTLDVATLSTEPLTDPVLIDTAERALRDAGFSAPRIRRLARTAGWPLIVSFTTEPGDESHQVWLRSASRGRLAVAGHSAPPDPVHRRSGGAVDPITDVGDRP